MSGAFGPPSLIASDVDGTLLGDDENITPRTRDVLVRAREAGVELVLATGRPPRWIPPITDQLAGTGAVPRFAVCANGAIVYDVDADRILQAWALQPDQLRQITEIVHDVLPQAGLAAERAGAAHDST
ncbi:MAG: HAD hydrolase family protein, partial [Gordonia sp. (in: high G+C Gram-positive bacteria)]